MRNIIIFLSLINLPVGLWGQGSIKTYDVRIVQAGWHTGIVIKTEDLPDYLSKEIRDERTHRYVDFSWGDEKYYQIPDPNLYIAARSVLWPTQSVISIDGFSRSIEVYYSNSSVFQFNLNKEKFKALCKFLAGSFQRDSTGHIIESIFYRTPSDFYLAKRKYWALRTCNTWVALALKHAGFEISPFLLTTSRQLKRRLNRMQNKAIK